MKLVVLGLSLSSSWGNGHATTYRALLKAFHQRGHEILFLERDQPWYAAQRDLPAPDFAQLVLYPDLAALGRHLPAIAAADAVIVGSYVPEGAHAATLVQRHARGVTAFYDIDTPVTLAKLASGDHEYLAPDNIPGFDLYLSFTGGPTLELLERRHGARRAAALYCSVDTETYRPLDRNDRWALSYLGTYSDDRQPALERLLLEPARARPDLAFAVAGPQYPDSIVWPGNVERFEHVGPHDHPAFYAASQLTLNVTRASMVAAGWSPSVRLFEAAACACPVVSDVWPGLDTLFTPETEIHLAQSTADVLALLDRPPSELAATGARARARVLAHHSAAVRARELETILAEAAASAPSHALAS